VTTAPNIPGLPLLVRAIAFAAEKHRNQRRKDKDASPYINHPIALVDVLANEGGIDDVTVLAAAVLHDTVEDTETTEAELRQAFGDAITDAVLAVSDDKTLDKAERKRMQVEHAATLTRTAKLVKLADKICNVRDVAKHPPDRWPLERRQAYFDWAKAVIDRLRGVHPGLEAVFDQAYRAKP
jgi:GTP diphosphokinase / guanosine-3',5'-bis(diphosphate) 3'-diphosphatase